MLKIKSKLQHVSFPVESHNCEWNPHLKDLKVYQEYNRRIHAVKL